MPHLIDFGQPTIVKQTYSGVNGLKRLKETEICLKKEKCLFMTDSVAYVGHKVDVGGAFIP